MRDVDSMQQLHRVAERHGRLPRDSPLARELVTDVIEDMFVGEVTCDLGRTLAQQIERHVRRRANRLRKANRPGRRRRNALRPEFIPLNEVPRSALVADPPQNAPDAAEVAPRIRELARDDEAAQRLLAFYDRGVVSRRDVLAAEMTEWVYRAARDRLAGYAVLAISTVSPAEPVTEQPGPHIAPGSGSSGGEAWAVARPVRRGAARTLTGAVATTPELDPRTLEQEAKPMM